MRREFLRHRTEGYGVTFQVDAVVGIGLTHYGTFGMPEVFVVLTSGARVPVAQFSDMKEADTFFDEYERRWKQAKTS